jgi:hypothetical protein
MVRVVDTGERVARVVWLPCWIAGAVLIQAASGTAADVAGIALFFVPVGVYSLTR